MVIDEEGKEGGEGRRQGGQAVFDTAAGQGEVDVEIERTYAWRQASKEEDDDDARRNSTGKKPSAG